MKLSVIIVSFNVRAELHHCLDALETQLDKQHSEIVIIDNASTDDTGEMVQTRFSEVVFHQNAENIGFAAANNIGVNLTSGEYIIFLNPDTIPLNGALDKMVETLDKYHGAAAVGPRAYWDTEKQFLISSLKIPTPLECWLTHSAASKLPVTRPLFARARHTDWNYWTQDQEAFTVPAVGGAYLMVRREALNHVGGGFDTSYFLGYEDVDLCRKLRDKGYSLLCDPRAEIIHLYGASKRKNPDKIAYCLNWQTEAQQYLVNHYGRCSAFCVHSMLKLEHWVREIRSRPSPDRHPEVPGHGHDSIHLRWPSTGAVEYLVEIATSPTFYDKFGHFTPNTHLKLHNRTITSLTPGIYYWRVFELPLQAHSRAVHQDRLSIP